MPSKRIVFALVTSLIITFASTAKAADVVSPRDGETINSQPQFMFDFADGSAAVEFSKSPDVKFAGSDPGAFVETAHTNFLLIGPDKYPAGVAEPWGVPRLNAGRYYWHAKADSYDDDIPTSFAPDTWGPTRTLIVRDERPSSRAGRYVPGGGALAVAARP